MIDSIATSRHTTHLGVKWSQVQILPSRPRFPLLRNYLRPLSRRTREGWVIKWALLGIIQCLGTVQAQEWSRAVEVDYVEMQAAEVTHSKMRQLRRKYGHAYQTSPAQAWRDAGLAILWQRDDGVYACNIYVLDINDKRVLDHEIRHCHGWVH